MIHESQRPQAFDRLAPKKRRQVTRELPDCLKIGKTDDDVEEPIFLVFPYIQQKCRKNFRDLSFM